MFCTTGELRALVPLVMMGELAGWNPLEMACVGLSAVMTVGAGGGCDLAMGGRDWLLTAGVGGWLLAMAVGD